MGIESRGTMSARQLLDPEIGSQRGAGGFCLPARGLFGRGHRPLNSVDIRVEEHLGSYLLEMNPWSGTSIRGLTFTSE